MPVQEKDLRDTDVSTPGNQEQRKQTIWFFGHFGLGNFGNESTLLSILSQLRTLLPDVELRCICTGPEATARLHDIATLPVSRVIFRTWSPDNQVVRLIRSILIGIPCELYRWIDGLMTLKGTDVLIVAGTGLVTDAYSLRGWGPYSLFKWSAIAKMRGCKLLFVSVGAGPIYSRLGRFLVKSALALADFRSYRDAASMHYLDSVGFARTNDRVYPDLAFSLPQALVPRDSTKIRRRPVVGLGLMLYAGQYSVHKPNMTTYHNYLESFVILVDWLLTRGNDVRLLIGDLCDRPVVEEFKCLLKERLPIYDASRIIDEPVESVEQLLSHIAETDLVVATRFHSVLFSLFSNKPVVAISFHHKVASLMSAMGLSEFCLDINCLKGDELIEKICEVERNVDGLRSMIRERVENNLATLEEQYECICREVRR